MRDDNLNSIFKKQWKVLGGILPVFTSVKPETQFQEPCQLILSKTSKQFDLPDIAFLFGGITPEVQEENNSSAENSNESTNSEPDEKVRTGWRRFTGILLALGATFSYSLATLIVKLLNYHPFLLSLWRFQGMIIPAIPFILFYTCVEKKPVFEGIWPLTEGKKLKALFFIFLRSIVGCSATVLQIFAVHKLNMADASVIVFSSPVFVTLAAHIFLGEKAGIFSIVMALFTLTGVGIIARPPMLTGEPMESEALIGAVYAVGSMLLCAFVYVLLRYLREIHYSIVTISYGLLGSIECLIMAAALDVVDLPHGLFEWILAAALIALTFLGQTAVVLALKFENAGLVSLIATTDVIFSFLWQLIFLGVKPDVYSLLGAFIVVLGVVLTTFRKWIGTLSEDHSIRRKLSWFLK